MTERYKDTDLREALRRRYAGEPELPAGFMERMEGRGRLARDGRKRAACAPSNRDRKRWPWMAAAAGLLLIIGIGILQTPPPTPAELDKLNSLQGRGVAARSDSRQELPTSVETVADSKQSLSTLIEAVADSKHGLSTSIEAVADSKHGLSTPVEAVADLRQGEPTSIEAVADSQQGEPPPVLADSNLHYAACTEEEAVEDTVPYQAPSRVDEFIALLADYHKVREGELTCTATMDSTVASRVYVFPDNREIDLFSRLLQVACRYSDKTPGYLLHFSHRQFFFELKDEHLKLHYRWIAERINGQILLYSTCSPVGVSVSSACYQDYIDQLMHTKNINPKTTEI